MRRLFLLVLAYGTAACAPAPPPLSHAADSPEALGRAVVERLATRDVAGLRQLMLTRDEFEAHVWPHLPASRPDTNMPMSFVWNRLQQQSEGHLAQTIARHGGQPLTFVGIATTGAASDYGTVRVDRDSMMTVRTASGDVEEVKLFGSIVRQGAHYKVFSYVTE
jgi:hypothetical protein